MAVTVNPIDEAFGNASSTCRAKPSMKSYWLPIRFVSDHDVGPAFVLVLNHGELVHCEKFVIFRFFVIEHTDEIAAD